MRFDELEYIRPDGGFAGEVARLTERAVNAADPAQAIEAVYAVNGIENRVSTQIALARIRFALNTEDAFYREELPYAEDTAARLSVAVNGFYTALSQSAHAQAAERVFSRGLFEKYLLKARSVSGDVMGELGEESRLIAGYRGLQSHLEAEFGGRTLPAYELGAYMRSGDRAVRKAAYLAYSAAFDRNAAEYDRIFSALVRTRTALARKLGRRNFIAVGYDRLYKGCYGEPEVCRFRENVLKYVVPFVSRLKAAQAASLGIDEIRIYDDNVKFPGGNPRPILSGEALVDAGFGVYRSFGSEGREFVDGIVSSGVYDLFPRRGKNNTAFCEGLPEYSLPFIFANLDGSASDVATFTHELGHAFAGYLAARRLPLSAQLDPTYESCEVQGMAMEFLSWPHYGRFYGEAAPLVKRLQLLEALELIPYSCMVDEFQHRVYDEPDMDEAGRCKVWQSLERKYRPYLATGDVPLWRDGRAWHRQSHIFASPFYYIDYALAQVVSLQLLDVMRRQGEAEAFERYRRFVEPGCTLSFLELLDAAGLQSPFEASTVKSAVDTAAELL